LVVRRLVDFAELGLSMLLDVLCSKSPEKSLVILIVTLLLSPPKGAVNHFCCL
jgi:hypothetical protein